MPTRQRKNAACLPRQNKFHWAYAWRVVLSAGVACAVASVLPPRADAGEWWQQITGHGTQFGSSNKTTNQTPKKYELEDLRKGPLPLRSEEIYAATREAVERYRKIANAGGWKPITSRRLIRPGDDDERIPLVRARLRATGDLSGKSSGYYYQSLTFDSQLEEAVTRFQKRHGLRLTRRIDRATIAAMNVSAEDRLHQLNLNLQRIAGLLQDRVEERYIFVNVPAFQLEAVERFSVERRHRVIVGKPGRDTPVIRATIRGLNFFPYWRVPESVARKDLIPRLQKEPEYLDKEHIRAYQGSYDGDALDLTYIDWTQVDPTKIFFRQEPGEWNALGVVRIDMPNEHVVYMHDTPLKELFGQSRRAFSAGCVRVQDVIKLVDWVAQKEEGWERPGRANQVVTVGEPYDVELKQPIPVYFAYVTAWGEPKGPPQFRADIYDRDGKAVFAGETDDDDFVPPPTALAP